MKSSTRLRNLAMASALVGMAATVSCDPYRQCDMDWALGAIFADYPANSGYPEGELARNLPPHALADTFEMRIDEAGERMEIRYDTDDGYSVRVAYSIEGLSGR